MALSVLTGCDMRLCTRLAPLVVLCIASLGTGCEEEEPPPEQRLEPSQVAEITSLLDEARSTAQAHEDRIAAIVRSGTFEASSRPCGVTIPSLASLAPITSEPLSNTQKVAARHVSRFIGPEGALISDMPGPVMDSVSRLRLWERRATAPVYSGTTDDLVERARSEIHPSAPPDHELVLVADEIRFPEIVGTDGFRPGDLRGRLFVVDAEGEVVCAADVHVQSGSTVRTSTIAARGGLILDLVARAVIVGHAGLRETVGEP